MANRVNSLSFRVNEYQLNGTIALFSIAVMLNLCGTVLFPATNGFLFLDTIGTAIMAFALGPWWAAAVGMISSTIASGCHFFKHILHYFAVLNALLGIAWGYLARTDLYPKPLSMKEPTHKIVGFILVAGLTAALLAILVAPIITFQVLPEINEGQNIEEKDMVKTQDLTQENYEYLIKAFEARNYDSAKILAKIIIEIPDKILTVLIAFFILCVFLPRVHLTSYEISNVYSWHVLPGQLMLFILIYIIHLIIWLNKCPQFWWLWLSPGVFCVVALLKGVDWHSMEKMTNLRHYVSAFIRRKFDANLIKSQGSSLTKISALIVLTCILHFLLLNYFYGLYNVMPLITLHKMLGSVFIVLLATLIFICISGFVLVKNIDIVSLPTILSRLLNKRPPKEVTDKSTMKKCEAFRNEFQDYLNVFIMARYYDTDIFNRLESIIRKSLEEHKFMAHFAKDREWSENLWENTCIYMIGCDYGICIFEEFEKREFNPNISIELGFMIGLNKPCLILKDKRMPELPSDVAGRLYKSIDAFKLEETVRTSINDWILNDLPSLKKCKTKYEI